MAGRTKQPDVVVAQRLYCRSGKRDTTFFYKRPDNTNEIFAKARTANKEAVARAKIAALQRWSQLRGMDGARPEERTVSKLIERYFEWQEHLPANSKLKKADSTIATNKYEQKPLLAFFGEMQAAAVVATQVYEYVDLRAKAKAALVAVKEVALLSAVFEYGRRIGWLAENVCHGIKLEGGNPKSRTVRWEEVDFVTKVGRSLGGSYHVAGLAARAAWLAFKRPGEVLGVPRSGTSPGGTPLGVTDDGLVFLGNKRRRTQGERTILIRWSPELRATVDEALKIGRWQVFSGSRLIFANTAGHRYSKSGWGTIWTRLMVHCDRRARWMEQPFQRFALADCRPGGVTMKKSARQDDVYDGTGHADRRMVDTIYDRRPQRESTPAR